MAAARCCLASRWVARGRDTGLAQQTVTGNAGEWRISRSAGRHRTSSPFELEGFRRLVRSGITVEAAVPRSVNVTLELGAITESITVQGAARRLLREND